MPKTNPLSAKSLSGAPIYQNKGSEKTPYVLNLSETMQEKMIRNAEKAITDAQTQINELLPDHKARYDFLMEVTRDFNAVDSKKTALEEEIKEQQNIIAAMNKFKAVSGDKVLKGITDVVVNTRTKAPKRIHWLDLIYDVLIKEDRFMTPDEIMNVLSKNEMVIELSNKTKKGFAGLRGAVIVNMITHAQFADKRKQGEQKLVIYQEKIGAVDWLTEEKELKFPTRHLKHFMHK